MEICVNIGKNSKYCKICFRNEEDKGTLAQRVKKYNLLAWATQYAKRTFAKCAGIRGTIGMLNSSMFIL